MTNVNQRNLKEVFITWHPQRDLTAAEADLVRDTFDVPAVERYYCGVENLKKNGEAAYVHFHICVTFHEPVLVSELRKRLKELWKIDFSGIRGGNKTELNIKPLDDFMRVAGGYATKADKGLFPGPSKGVSILDLKKGNEEYVELMLSKKPVTLNRSNVLHQAFLYRKQHKLTTNNLFEVLSQMSGNGYCMSGLSGRYKMPREFKTIFSMRCQGQAFSTTMIEELFVDSWNS